MVTKAKIANSMDEIGKSILYEGANLSELSVLFRMDHRKLVEKLHNVPHSNLRNGHKVWKIDEVAPHLVKPIYDIERYMQTMAHTDLPKMLTKEYWAGQRSRQLFEKDAGILWPTAEVIEKVGELMQIFKMSARQFMDAVDRQAELTDKQRNILKGLTDGMLIECHHRSVKNFKPPKLLPSLLQAPPPPEDDDEL
jgi:hypothetical protein